jgi:hypothetical protein
MNNTKTALAATMMNPICGLCRQSRRIPAKPNTMGGL